MEESPKKKRKIECPTTKIKRRLEDAKLAIDKIKNVRLENNQVVDIVPNADNKYAIKQFSDEELPVILTTLSNTNFLALNSSLVTAYTLGYLSKHISNKWKYDGWKDKYASIYKTWQEFIHAYTHYSSTMISNYIEVYDRIHDMNIKKFLKSDVIVSCFYGESGNLLEEYLTSNQEELNYWREEK